MRFFYYITRLNVNFGSNMDKPSSWVKFKNSIFNPTIFNPTIGFVHI